MKLFIAVVSVLLVGLVAGDTCHKATENKCRLTEDPNTSLLDLCSPIVAHHHVANSLQAYANNQLSASYDLLLLSTNFDKHDKERQGFTKLFRSLSDEAFEDTIKLIKHMTKRGVNADLWFHANANTQGVAKNFEVNEVEALAKALDVEKELYYVADSIHKRVAKHPDNSAEYDAEIGHFLEKDFLAPKAETIRKLSGYSNDLLQIIGDSNVKNLGVYLFDEYLQKQ